LSAKEIVDKLNVTINAIVADPTSKGKLADLGRGFRCAGPTSIGSSPPRKWVIKLAGIKPE
jgi:hypothetical protein